MKRITKKEFKELADIHTYGKGERRIVALFYDWKSGESDVTDENFGGKKYFAGFKYMIQGVGTTKPDILRDAYNMLILDDYTELCWYNTRTAKTDLERFKVPVTW